MKYVEGARRVFLQTGTKFPREVIWAVALIKNASAKANCSLGRLDEKIASSIVEASKEVSDGKHDGEVTVDVFQTGSGTGINMNVNELIAELASERSGLKVHPNDHVNMGQSSNDVVPTAVRIAAISLATKELIPAMDRLVKALETASHRTSTVYKAGRTHLRDAMPVTLGQELGAYADAYSHDRTLTSSAMSYVKELPIGGTAVGTGINTHPKFGGRVITAINSETGIGFVGARNKFRAMRLVTDLGGLSAAMRLTALDLYRLCQDIRLMFSGPLTGLGEIELPTQEEVAGSSIMPGKTNPVTVEASLLACSQVIGLDQAVQMACMLGEFELSMGVPLVGYDVCLEAKLLSEALNKMASLVITPLVPDVARARRYAETSPSLITVLSPVIGYDEAAKIGKRLTHGLTIRDALKEIGYSDEEIGRILDLKKLVGARPTGR